MSINNETRLKSAINDSINQYNDQLTMDQKEIISLRHAKTKWKTIGIIMILIVVIPIVIVIGWITYIILTPDQEEIEEVINSNLILENNKNNENNKDMRY